MQLLRLLLFVFETNLTLFPVMALGEVGQSESGNKEVTFTNLLSRIQALMQADSEKPIPTVLATSTLFSSSSSRRK